MNPEDRLRLLSQILLGAGPFESRADGGHLNFSFEHLDSVRPLHKNDLDENDLTEIRALADSHHVVMRTFPALERQLATAGNLGSAAWIEQAIDTERVRIGHALSFLDPICQALAEVGQVIVIKSLDHWPDLGSDLDLFAEADAPDIVAVMKKRFRATPAQRSWGDRLANKWNFIVPGLPELVEVHVSRLGQTGEQTAIARSLIARAHPITLGEHAFRTPSPEDRIVISTLQRMYRHFYIRLCDIVDNARLLESGTIDFSYLRRLGVSAGLWTGLATYLTVISGYVESFRSQKIQLPSEVTSAARLKAEQVYFRKNFLRIPILPHSASFYASELGRLMRNGEIVNTLRLSLLPGLATAAALEFKLTGSDKGIW